MTAAINGPNGTNGLLVGFSAISGQMDQDKANANRKYRTRSCRAAQLGRCWLATGWPRLLARSSDTVGSTSEIERSKQAVARVQSCGPVVSISAASLHLAHPALCDLKPHTARPDGDLSGC